jgi:hypothetical protein
VRALACEAGRNDPLLGDLTEHASALCEQATAATEMEEGDRLRGALLAGQTSRGA